MSSKHVVQIAPNFRQCLAIVVKSLDLRGALCTNKTGFGVVCLKTLQQAFVMKLFSHTAAITGKLGDYLRDRLSCRVSLLYVFFRTGCSIHTVLVRVE